MTHQQLAAANRLQDTAVAPCWRSTGFLALSLIFHLLLLVGLLRHDPEPPVLMAGREGGVVAMTLLSVAESHLAPSAAAATQADTPTPEPQSSAVAASVTVPDAIIPLQSAPAQKTVVNHPTAADKPRAQPRPEKPPRSKQQNDTPPVRQQQRVTQPAPVANPAPAPHEAAVNRATHTRGEQATESVAVAGNTSSAAAAKSGSSNSGQATQGAGNSSNQNFKALHRRVNYPQRARALGVEGRVRIQFDITASGTVTNVRILSETPNGVFAAAIRPDIARWRYQTQAAVSDQVVSIVFKLNGQVQLEN